MNASLETPTCRFPTVSVALATFNGASFLAEQLQSLAEQTLLPSELVVCDDRSSDDTPAIVESFAATAPFPVRLHRNADRLGYRANFMRAAEACDGQLIAFCDQDDYWHPTKLARMVEPFDDADVLMAHHGAQLVDANRRRLGTLHPYGGGERETPPMSHSPWIFPLGFAQVFRRELLEFSDLRCATVDFHKPSERCAHDQWIALLAYSLGKVRFISDELVDYRQHGANTVGLRYEPDRRSSLKRLAAKIDAHPNYGVLSQAAACYADIFGTVENERRFSRWAKRARIASEEHRWVADLYRLRTETFSATNIFRRWKSWAELRRRGGYASVGWSFGDRGRKLDWVRGVLLARLRDVSRPALKHDYHLKKR